MFSLQSFLYYGVFRNKGLRNTGLGSPMSICELFRDPASEKQRNIPHLRLSFLRMIGELVKWSTFQDWRFLEIQTLPVPCIVRPPQHPKQITIQDIYRFFFPNLFPAMSKWDQMGTCTYLQNVESACLGGIGFKENTLASQRVAIRYFVSPFPPKHRRQTRRSGSLCNPRQKMKLQLVRLKKKNKS